MMFAQNAKKRKVRWACLPQRARTISHMVWAEEEDLDGRAGGVPERPADAVLPRDVGALEERGRPRPLRHDDGGREAGLDHAARGVEVLAGDGGVAGEGLVEVDDDGREDGEERAEADDDEVAHGLRERERVAEVRVGADVVRIL